MPYVPPHTGVASWDLHDHFVDCTRGYGFDDDPCYWEPVDGLFLSRMSIYEPRAGVPDFAILIGSHGGDFGLWYGWEGSTFHQHDRWSLGAWRQDLTDQTWCYSGSDLGYMHQRRDAQEIGRDAERRLGRVFARLKRFRQTGHYDLEWPEVGALMANTYDQFKQTVQCAFGQGDDVHVSRAAGDRGCSIGFELSGAGWRESPLRISATSGISAGCQLNIFAPYSVSGDCPWYEGIVFRSEHTDPDALLVQCPLPHTSPHRMSPTVVDPWNLKEYLSEECLPWIAEGARNAWSPAGGLYMF